MKKIVLLLIMIFMLTGCSVEYNLIISEDSITEDIYLKSENENESNIIYNYLKPVEAFIDSPMNSESNEKLDGVEYYVMNKNINSLNLYELNLNYKFNYDDFINSNIVNQSVSLFEIDKSYGVYYLDTGASLNIFDLYPELNTLKVSISLNELYEIVDTNADKIIDNVYIWNVTRNNYTSNPISISFKEKPVEEENQYEEENNNENEQKKEVSKGDILLVLTLLGGFLVVLVLLIILTRKNNK